MCFFVIFVIILGLLNQILWFDYYQYIIYLQNYELYIFSKVKTRKSTKNFWNRIFWLIELWVTRCMKDLEKYTLREIYCIE